MPASASDVADAARARVAAVANAVEAREQRRLRADRCRGPARGSCVVPGTTPRARCRRRTSMPGVARPRRALRRCRRSRRGRSAPARRPCAPRRGARRRPARARRRTTSNGNADRSVACRSSPSQVPDFNRRRPAAFADAIWRQSCAIRMGVSRGDCHGAPIAQANSAVRQWRLRESANSVKNMPLV